AVPAPAPAWIAGTAALALALLAGNVALQHAAARLPASVTALVMLSEIVFAALSSVWLGGEALEPRTLAGGAMIVLAAALAAMPRRRRVND
ncbi:MAG: EamA family transporter, partial [Gammaproteobacteria bacterium]